MNNDCFLPQYLLTEALEPHKVPVRELFLVSRIPKHNSTGSFMKQVRKAEALFHFHIPSSDFDIKTEQHIYQKDQL